MNDEEDGNKASGMIHHNVQINSVYRKEEKVRKRTFSTNYLIPKNYLTLGLALVKVPPTLSVEQVTQASTEPAT